MKNDNLQSLANQLGWCITTKDYLNNLINEFNYLENKYKTMVDELKSMGYMADLLTQIQKMNEELQEVSSDLKKHIYEHLAYIEKQSTGIREVLEKLLK